MSASLYVQTIVISSDQFVIISGFIIIIIGLIGNLLNIMIFTGLKLFRGNQCVFYIIIGSIVDCGTLLIEFITRIEYRLYQYDLTDISLFWCKLRAMLLQITIMTSLITVCFLSIDQYLSTNYRYDIRQMSTLKLAQRLTIINVCFWIVHSIPFGVFYEINSLLDCTILNQGFKHYYAFAYLFILNGVFPLITSAVFSILSYYNVRRIIRLQIPVIRRKLDRQLTVMVLTRVLFLFIVSVPFGLQLIYSVSISNNTTNLTRIAIEKFVIDITSTLYYFNYAGSFYLYWFSSARFRRQMNYLFFKKIWPKFYEKICIRGTVRHIQVAPISHISSNN